jgi:hypothetical protein
VRPLIVKTAEEKKRFAEAAARREARLELRARNQKSDMGKSKARNST